MLLAVCLFIAFGACCYRLLITSGFRSLHLAREAEDRLFGHFRALTEGIKELKLHRERRGVFLNDGVQSATADFQRHNIAAETHFILAHNWGHLLFFLLMGLILFLLPTWEHLGTKTMSGYVMTTLYLMGPLAGVMGSIALFGVRKASLTDEEHAGQGLTFVLEITNIVDALHLNNALDVDALNVRIVPVKPVPEDAQVSIGRVSIFRQGR